MTALRRRARSLLVAGCLTALAIAAVVTDVTARAQGRGGSLLERFRQMSIQADARERQRRSK